MTDLSRSLPQNIDIMVKYRLENVLGTKRGTKNTVQSWAKHFQIFFFSYILKSDNASTSYSKK